MSGECSLHYFSESLETFKLENSYSPSPIDLIVSQENQGSSSSKPARKQFVIRRENRGANRLISLSNRQLSFASVLAFVLIAFALLLNEISTLLLNLATPGLNKRQIWAFWISFASNAIAFVAVAIAGIVLSNIAFRENSDQKLKYVAMIALILALLGLIPGNTITITL